MSKNEQEYKIHVNAHASREELFTGIEGVMHRTRAVLDKLAPIIEAENKYLEQSAAEMGIEHYHIKSKL